MTLLKAQSRHLIQGLPLSYTVNTTTGTLPSGAGFTAKTPVAGPGYMGVIYCHSGLQSNTQADVNPALGVKTFTDMLAGAGFPVIASDDGGNLWGRPDQIDPFITEAQTYLVSTMGADSYGQYMLFGASMGGLDALSYASRNLSKVAGFVGIVPVSDLFNLYAQSDPTINASIDAAYGTNTNRLALFPTADPTTLAQQGKFAGLRYKSWYGTADTTVPASTVTTLAGLIPGAVTISTPSSHALGLLQPYPNAILAFVASCYLRTTRGRKSIKKT